MTAKEKASEMALFFNTPQESIPPNTANIQNAIKCCQQIIRLEALTDDAWLNIPDEYKIQYWKEVIKELTKM